MQSFVGGERGRALRAQLAVRQWMVDPVEDGGLGLDPPTVATMVGHDDGGYLIATVYTKLGERRALARAQRAMDAYQQRRPARGHLRLAADD